MTFQRSNNTASIIPRLGLPVFFHAHLRQIRRCLVDFCDVMSIQLPPECELCPEVTEAARWIILVGCRVRCACLLAVRGDL